MKVKIKGYMTVSGTYIETVSLPDYKPLSCKFNSVCIAVGEDGNYIYEWDEVADTYSLAGFDVTADELRKMGHSDEIEVKDEHPIQTNVKLP